MWHRQLNEVEFFLHTQLLHRTYIARIFGSTAAKRNRDVVKSSHHAALAYYRLLQLSLTGKVCLIFYFSIIELSVPLLVKQVIKTPNNHLQYSDKMLKSFQDIVTTNLLISNRDLVIQIVDMCLLLYDHLIYVIYKIYVYLGGEHRLAAVESCSLLTELS